MNPETHPIDYKSKFEHSELEKVKLTQEYDNGSKRQKQCPVYSGKHGIEALLFVEERFRKIAAQMEWTDHELFDNFEEVLVDAAEDDWEEIVDGIAEADRTTARFDECMQQYYLKYCQRDSRDVMFEYLVNQCRKPIGEEPRTHVARMTTLYRYSNKLPGSDPPKTTEQMKMPIFKTFPETWRQTFIRSGKNVADGRTSIQDIVDFMTTEKAFADKSSTDKGKNKRKSEGDNEKPNVQKKKNKGKPTSGPEAPCKLPGHRNHKWKDCFDNPKGNNYRPRGSGGRGGGGRNSYNRNNDRGGRGGNRDARYGNGQGQSPNNNDQNYHYQDNDQGRRSERETGNRAGNNNNNNNHAQTRQQDAKSDHYYNERSQGTRVHWW
jgi:hypothetical protein